MTPPLQDTLIPTEWMLRIGIGIPSGKINSMEDWYEIETITPDLVIEGIDRIL
jgi:hypothetical protein